MVNKIRAMIALFHLLRILLPLLLTGRVTFSVDPTLEDAAQVRFENGIAHITLRSWSLRTYEDRASLLHELYHVAQWARNVDWPIGLPAQLPQWLRDRISEAAAQGYPPERRPREYAAEVWSRAVARSLWPHLS